MAKRSKSAEFDMLVGVGSPGLACLGVMRNLMRGLRAKGVFSDIELLGIFEASIELARGTGGSTSERTAQFVQQEIRQLQESVLKPASSPQVKH